MRDMRRILVATLAGLALTGCGGKDKAAAPSTAVPSLADTAKACLYTTPAKTPSTGIPLELLPKETLVTKNAQTNAVRLANFFFGRSVGDTYNAILANAKATGWKVSRSENEAFEAEVYAAKGKLKVTIRLSQIQRCRESANGLMAVNGEAA